MDNNTNVIYIFSNTKYKEFINLNKKKIILILENKDQVEITKKNDNNIIYYKRNDEYNSYISCLIDLHKKVNLINFNIIIDLQYNNWINTVIKYMFKYNNFYKENKKDFIFYYKNTSLPYIKSGYSERGHQLVKNYNKNIENREIIIITRPNFPKKSKIIIEEYDRVKYIRLNQIDSILGLDYLIKIFNPKILQVVTPPNNLIEVISFFKRKKIKCIYEIRGSWDLSCKINNKIKKKEEYVTKYLSNENIVCRNVDKIIPITRQIQKKVMKLTKITDMNKYFILPNCFEVSKIKKENINYNINYKKQLGLDNNFIIGYFGSIVKYEGINWLCKAIEILSKTITNIKFLLISKELPDEYKKYNFIIFQPYVDNNILYKYYKLLDLYIIPRLSYEVCEVVSPIKPFEPLGLKVPLLLSSVEPLLDISENEKNCYIFKKNDLFDLIYKIKDIYYNGYKKEILENGYNYVINKRNWKLYVNKLDEVYCNLLK